MSARRAREKRFVILFTGGNHRARETHSRRNENSRLESRRGCCCRRRIYSLRKISNCKGELLTHKLCFPPRLHPGALNKRERLRLDSLLSLEKKKSITTLGKKKKKRKQRDERRNFLSRPPCAYIYIYTRVHISIFIISRSAKGQRAQSLIIAGRNVIFECESAYKEVIESALIYSDCEEAGAGGMRASVFYRAILSLST